MYFGWQFFIFALQTGIFCSQWMPAGFVQMPALLYNHIIIESYHLKQMLVVKIRREFPLNF